MRRPDFPEPQRSQLLDKALAYPRIFTAFADEKGRGAITPRPYFAVHVVGSYTTIRRLG
jgi:hypothetical protein